MKKHASARRAACPLAASCTKHFSKDWEKLSRSGRYDMRQLKEAMLLLIANDGPLGSGRLDHPLNGEWADFCERHIGGDFLLIYRLEGEIVVFAHAGTHSELFE